MTTFRTLLATTTAIGFGLSAQAADVEVTHWWTSGGEAAAVAELAKALNERTDHNWVDGAIAGSGNTARPIMISRITGGDPMAATMFNHGRQAEELVEAGLMRDITEVAEANNWEEVINPPELLDACTLDGRVYCAPVNIHSAQWMWLSTEAYESADIPMPTSWTEFVETAPQLQEAGIIPLALGQQAWQQALIFQDFVVSLVPTEVYLAVYGDKDAEVAAGEDMLRVFQATATARDLASESTVQDWNQATNLVITGQAGAQIMGDWAQGEFQAAGLTAGEEYECLPGLGEKDVLLTGGDAFYFPVVDDEEVTAAQADLAELLVSPEVQVAFNAKKGSLPVRGDVDMSSVNECTQKGLEILQSGETVPDQNLLITSDTRTRIEDLLVEFFADTSITPEDAQERFVGIIEDAR